MLINLECRGFRGKRFPFRVELLTHALEHLVNDARNAYRVYELFSIQRPGDTLKYIWIRLLDVPEPVQRRYTSAREAAADKYGREHPWPENQIPLIHFDRFFSWYWDDTEPEDECWLAERESVRFQEHADALFAEILKAQQELESQQDTLITHEIAQLKSRLHSFDYEAELPFLRTRENYRTIAMPIRTEAYYAKLKDLLRDPEIQSIASRGDTDFQTVRICCVEQRRRANSSGLKPLDTYPISILSDGVNYIKAWESEVMFFCEGLGYGDIWIEQTDGSGDVSIKVLVEKYGRKRPRYFTFSDHGDIRGYSREAGCGWYLYVAVG
jgi:hypothetical protein